MADKGEGQAKGPGLKIDLPGEGMLAGGPSTLDNLLGTTPGGSIGPATFGELFGRAHSNNIAAPQPVRATNILRPQPLTPSGGTPGADAARGGRPSLGFLSIPGAFSHKALTDSPTGLFAMNGVSIPVLARQDPVPRSVLTGASIPQGLDGASPASFRSILGFASGLSPVGLSPGAEAPWVTLGGIGQSPYDRTTSPHGAGQSSKGGEAAGKAGTGEGAGQVSRGGAAPARHQRLRRRAERISTSRRCRSMRRLPFISRWSCTIPQPSLTSTPVPAGRRREGERRIRLEEVRPKEHSRDGRAPQLLQVCSSGVSSEKAGA